MIDSECIARRAEVESGFQIAPEDRVRIVINHKEARGIMTDKEAYIQLTEANRFLLNCRDKLAQVGAQNDRRASVIADLLGGFSAALIDLMEDLIGE